jgi:autotransporter-associated beta strand protein
LNASVGDITVNNAISNGTAALNIISQAASGSVTLKAAQGAGGIGAVTIGESGVLKLGINDALRTNQNLTLGFSYEGTPTGTFDLAGFNQTVNALATNGTTATNSSRVVTNSAASGTSTLTVSSGTFNGVINNGATAAVALTKSSTGALNLSGNSNYSGVTAINAGTITISHANALGSTTGNTTIAYNGATSGGLLRLSGGITTAENITITGKEGPPGSYDGALGSSSGTNTFSGTITLTGVTGGGTIRLGTGTTIFSGNITQTGLATSLTLVGNTTVNNAIAINGNALIILGGSGATSTLKGVSGNGIGDTVIAQDGILILGVSDALNTTGNLNVAGFGGADQGTFSLTGFNQTVNALNSSASGTNRIVRNNSATTASILTVGNGGGTGAFNGTIVNGAAATLALVKTGAGTQTLSGTNTYTGGTTISQGTLALTGSGSINDSASVTIEPGATLDTSAQASYTIPTGKPVNFGVDGTGSGSSGKINAAALNVSNATVTYDITGPLDDAAYVLATYTGTLTGTFLSAPADPTGYMLDYDYEGNKIALVATGGNLAPGISDIADLSVPSGGNTGALAFTITDEDVNSVTPSGSSSNPTLVPNGNIVFGGSGANRTVIVTPVSGLSGSATITVTLTDNGSLTAQDTFTLTVTDNYLSWATANNVTGGPNGDHDNDGVKNLVEYALVDGGERGVLSGNTITYAKRGGVYGSDLTYMIETSETLASDSWTDVVTHGPGLLLSNPTISYTFTPGTPAKEFARLQVTSP